MDIKFYSAGPIEPGVTLPTRAGACLSPSQQRVLELQDGDSFVLHTIRIAEAKNSTAKRRSNKIADTAAHLAAWARQRQIRLAYRVIEKDTARIWRLGLL